MMNQPSLDLLMQKADSRYSLVVAAAKRARVLTDKENAGLIAAPGKPVTVALQEIADGKVLFKPRPKA